MLRAFQTVHRAGVDPGFMADLELLRHKDLDLSVKLGALLAFDALLIGAGLQPVSASPGAPLSVSAVDAPAIVAITLAGVGLLLAAAFYSVRGVMVGEEFDDGGIEDDPAAISQRMFAAYCAAMWATKGTTIGGIICSLKVVRLDDRPLDWGVAVVRTLGGFLSLFVAGLGFIWVAFDDEKQSWHDKIAGTTIVRVPKGTALL